MLKFSVVIISYNGRLFLERCLDDVFKSLLKPFKIIVVDNCSTDGTEEMVRKNYPSVIFLRNDKNLGPTASRNKGSQFAEGDYIVFIDNDTLVHPDSFKNLVSFLEKNSDAGIVGAKLLDEEGKKIWWNFGHNPNNLRESLGYICGFFLKIFSGWQRLRCFSMKFILNYWNYDKTIDVGWVIEACFAIKRDVFDKIGGFDESFFMFFEGPDLCYRIGKLGYKTYFYPKAVAKILPGHTRTGFERAFLFIRSKYRFYKKHYFYRKSNPIFFWLGQILNVIFYTIS